MAGMAEQRRTSVQMAAGHPRACSERLTAPSFTRRQHAAAARRAAREWFHRCRPTTLFSPRRGAARGRRYSLSFSGASSFRQAIAEIRRSAEKSRSVIIKFGVLH